MNKEVTPNGNERGEGDEWLLLSQSARDLLNSLDMPILFLDRDCRLLHVTERMSSFFDIRQSDLGRPIDDLSRRLGSEQICDDVHEVRETGEPVEREFRSDHDKWFLSRVLPFHSSDTGEPVGPVITFVDITERKSAEQARSASERRLHALVQTTLGVIYRMSPDWAALRHLEGGDFVDDQEEPNVNWMDKYIPEHERSRVREEIERAMREDRMFELEHQVRTRDGSLGWTWSRAIPIHDDRGEVIEWYGVASDITGRKHAEEQMEASKEFAEKIVETLANPLLVLNEDLTVNEANPAFYEHFGVTPEETIGTRIYDLGNGQWDIPALRELLEGVLPDDNAFDNYEVDHQFDGLGRRVMLLNGRRLDHVQRILLGINDITDRAQTREALERAHDKLERRVSERTERLKRLTRELLVTRQRERKRLAGLLHDDLQQYLVALQMQVSKARKQTDDDTLDETLEKCEELVYETLRAGSDLTRELRPPILSEEGLLPALRWQIEEMKDRHELIVNLDTDDFDLELDEDIRMMLFQSIRELLLNVVKHTEVNRADLICRQEDDRITFSVHDHGKGFVAEDVMARKRTGSGLGLVSIRERMEALEGELLVQSVPGDGARITLELPRSIATGGWMHNNNNNNHNNHNNSHTGRRSHASDMQGRETQTSGSGNGPTVLVVDDHDVVREGIIHLLESDERVRVAGQAVDGEEAMQQAEILQPDIVLMDVSMPRCNGIEATRRIRQQWSHVQVVGLSVQDDRQTNRSMREAGAKAFISKSDDVETMVTVILGLCPIDAGLSGDAPL